MLVKFFSNRHGGSDKSIDYLLNFREEEGTARILNGNPIITRNIINELTFKQKVTVVCLSFEEEDIDEELKLTLINSFEKHLMPGMEDRYNILCVEHIDKKRLELNIVIPKIDLVTQKSFNPYFHKDDLLRVDSWQNLQNAKYGFSDPHDPSKKRTACLNTKWEGLDLDYAELDEKLHSFVTTGVIINRKELIDFCRGNDIEIVKVYEECLYLKMPDYKEPRKFQGGIYNEQFTSYEAISRIWRKTEEGTERYSSRDTHKKIEYFKRILDSATESKQLINKTRYLNIPGKHKYKYSREFNKDRKYSEEKLDNNHNYIVDHNIANFNVFSDVSRTRSYNRSRYRQYRENNKNLLYVDREPQERELDDIIRAEINERISIRKEFDSGTIEKIGSKGKRLYKRIESDIHELHRKNKVESSSIHTGIKINIEELRGEHDIDKTRLLYSNRGLIYSIKGTYEKCRDYNRGGLELLVAIERTKELIQILADTSARLKDKCRKNNDEINRDVYNLELINDKSLYNIKERDEDTLDKNLEITDEELYLREYFL